MRSALPFALLVGAMGLGMLALSGCGNGTVPSSPPEATPQLKTLSGADIFEASCAGCHANGGNQINPSKPVTGSPKLADLETFTQYLRQPTGGMPAFSETDLNAAQVKALFEHLKKG